MTSHVERKPILERIEAARDSRVLLYVTGDRAGMETQISPEVGDLFVDHLDAIWDAGPPTKRLTLIMHTRGGSV